MRFFKHIGQLALFFLVGAILTQHEVAAVLTHPVTLWGSVGILVFATLVAVWRPGLPAAWRRDQDDFWMRRGLTGGLEEVK